MMIGGKLGNDGRSYLVVRVVDNLLFEFNEGVWVGLIGYNGFGKIILLRVLVGIYVLVIGFMEIYGWVVLLLDVLMGLDLDVIGFENIYLCGIV